MSLFKKILFPVDLSDASEKIAPYIKEMARKFDSELYFVYVVNVKQYYSGLDMSTEYLCDVDSEIREKAKNKIRVFKETVFKNFSVQEELLSGRPGPEIVKYVKSAGIDLVIMGHSSTGIERAIFGSVAGYVVKYSPAPVLIISPSIIVDKKRR
ncbi:universal stress protein [Thermodesulfobacteriota bacterium]